MVVPETEIVVTQDGAEVVRKSVRPGDYVIGRDGGCDLPIAGDTVSGRHAQITIHSDHVLIKDLGSDSGTFINGQRVTASTRLWPSQKVQVGAATITLHRKRAPTDPDDSVPPQTAAVRRLLPEEILREQKYDIGGQIAQGGMGAILSAKEIAIRREVAMKVMLGSTGQEDLLRFVEEAQITGQLEHPNIVPVHELSVDENDQVFYTMKLVRGVTLRQVLEQLAQGDAETVRKYPLSALLTVFQKVCDAVAFAHSKGVIHRDLKPDNIMLGDYGEVLVMDWGLAKQMRNAECRMRNQEAAPPEEHSAFRTPHSAFTGTVAGSIMGTPQYMAPEQARGEIDALDARSDIYALGAILYHVLTLHPPVEGGTLDEILAKVSAGQFIPPIQRVSGANPRPSAPLPKPARPLPHAADPDAPTLIHEEAVVAAPLCRGAATERRGYNSTSPRLLPHLPGGSVPESLNAVVLKAMALEQAARYQSIAALQADLTSYQTGFATTAEKASLMKQIILLIKRHKGVFATAAAAWLIITALAVWFIISIRASERKATHNAEVAAENEKKAERNAQEAQRNAHIAAKNEHQAVQEKENTRRALAKSQLALAEAAFREQDTLAMQAALNAVPEDLRESNWNYLLEKSDTSLSSIGTSYTPEQAAPDPTNPGVFAIVTAKDQRVAVVEARTGVMLLTFQPGYSEKSSSGLYRIAFSPDGESLAVGRHGGGGIVIHSARDGKKLMTLETADTDSLQFSPDGRQLLEVSEDKQINLWDPATGKRIWSQPGGSRLRAVFDSSGQAILSYSELQKLRLLNSKDGSLLRELPGPPQASVVSMAIHPNGKYALTGDTLGFVRCLNLSNGAVQFQIRANDQPIRSLACTPDGSRFVTLANLAGSRRSIQVWDASTGSLLQPLLGGGGTSTFITVHPLSGELVVCGTVTKTWDMANEAEKWTIPVVRSDYATIAFWGEDELFTRKGTENVIQLLSLSSRVPSIIWKADRKADRMVSVSTNGRFAVISTASSANLSSMQLLHKDGERVEAAPAFEWKGFTHLLRLSPMGDHVFVAGRYPECIFDTTTGKEVTRLNKEGLDVIYDAGWSGNTQLIAAVTAKAHRSLPNSEEQLVLFNASTGARLKTVTLQTPVSCLAVSPDRKIFAEAGTDRMVRLRDSATLELREEFRGHDAPLTVMAWHPSQPILATASEDLTIKLWNTETGRRLAELRGPLAAPVSLTFSPSGKRLACLSLDNKVRVWEPQVLNPDALARVPADGWEDLLVQLKPADVAKNGWKLNNGALLSPKRAFAAVPLAGNFSQASYQVRVKLRQLAPKDVFAVVLPVADRQVAFNLDGFPEEGHFTSPALIDGQNSQTVPGALHGKQIRDSDQHELQVSVRLEGAKVAVEATLDDAPLYQWSGPVTSLSLNPIWSAVPPGSLALGTSGADWVVYAVKVKRLEK